MEFRATELLFHLKIKNFNCELQIYAADTRIEISVDFKIIEARVSIVSTVFKFSKFLVVKVLLIIYYETFFICSHRMNIKMENCKVQN